MNLSSQLKYDTWICITTSLQQIVTAKIYFIFWHAKLRKANSKKQMKKKNRLADYYKVLTKNIFASNIYWVLRKYKKDP